MKINQDLLMLVISILAIVVYLAVRPTPPEIEHKREYEPIRIRHLSR